MKLTTRSLSDLKPYPRNARTHSPAQVKQLAAVINEYGWTNPVLLDEHDVIIAGHGRILAARELGMDKVPCITVKGLTPAQVDALRLADNRLALDAGWNAELLSEELKRLEEADFDLGLTGFNQSEIDKHLKGFERKIEAQVSLAPDCTAQEGDVWTLGPHRLMCGDATNAEHVKTLMNGERAILCATDPPYFVDYKGDDRPMTRVHAVNWRESYGHLWKEGDIDEGRRVYREFIKVALDEAVEQNAAWYVWYASRRKALLTDAWHEFGILEHQTIIWNKNFQIPGRSLYYYKHEEACVGWKQGKKPPRLANSPQLTTVWDVDAVPRGSIAHPAVKPLLIWQNPMETHVERDQLCYEPFCGSGSQIIAANKIGRRCFAMELNPAFVDVAIRWWIKETNTDPVDQHGKTWTQRGGDPHYKPKKVPKSQYEGDTHDEE